MINAHKMIVNWLRLATTITAFNFAILIVNYLNIVAGMNCGQ